jgi:type VI secretion system protein
MRSILDDIRTAAANERTEGAAVTLRSAVLSDLRDMCVTPRRTVLLAPDYGLEESARLFHEYPSSIGAFEEDLVTLISHFEPRLFNLSVRHIAAEDLVLRFDVSATLVTGAASLPVQFSAFINAQGNVELK